MGVRIAWHTPSDISPVGLAVNTHLNIHLHNAAIQKQSSCRQIPNPCLLAVPNQRRLLLSNGKSGIGITFDEEAAADFPVVYRPHEWTQSRTPDGTLITP